MHRVHAMVLFMMIFAFQFYLFLSIILHFLWLSINCLSFEIKMRILLFLALLIWIQNSRIFKFWFGTSLSRIFIPLAYKFIVKLNLNILFKFKFYSYHPTAISSFVLRSRKIGDAFEDHGTRPAKTLILPFDLLHLTVRNVSSMQPCCLVLTLRVLSQLFDGLKPVCC